MTASVRRRSFLTLAALASLMLFAGCSNPVEEKEKAAPQQPNASAPVSGKLKIAGIGFQDDQFFRLTELGMKAAAEKYQVDFTPSSSAGNLDKEVSLIDAYITQKVNALVIAPISLKSSVVALQRASDSGIKVITFDNYLEKDFPVCGIKSDQVSLGRQTGQEAVKYIQEKMGGKAKIAILTYLSLLPEPASQRNKGFEDEVKKLPGVEVVAKQDAWMASEAINVAERLLTAHPDVNLIWAANEGGTVGAVTAVRNAGKAGKIVVFGTDISEQIADFLLADDNILQAVTGQKPYEIGFQALETAVKALKGEKTEKRVELPGALFARRLSEEVKKHKDYLHGLAK